ncbi:uncharacterized protein I303_106035 [Kwoniella dejecticola CBS 10117]|uniref:Uncharacterized protein n=1 Tax=Kwoniella dejecticola CBS 10117 TaxID=1296121 RepID=A0A1A6A140_9TREE|nr:uncharacterized protein I303_06055 [Kwoniella dejecticola CBS 10117]OBR83773.1 hypothetical protein I303_06055 [Kwoniella dejecticola CBS 10117]
MILPVSDSSPSSSYLTCENHHSPRSKRHRSYSPSPSHLSSYYTPSIKLKRRKLLKRLRQDHRQISSAYLFIGRLASPPFVFSSVGNLTKSNLNWIFTGNIDEGSYLAEEDLRRSTRPEGKVWELSIDDGLDPLSSIEREEEEKGISGTRRNLQADLIDLTSA